MSIYKIRTTTSTKLDTQLRLRPQSVRLNLLNEADKVVGRDGEETG